MKNCIPFEIFGENQFLKFDVMRLAELERTSGATITHIVTSGDVGVAFALAALPIGLRQHYPGGTPQLFAGKLQDYLEGGGDITSVLVPLIQAILASGVMGKTVQARAMASIDAMAPQNEEQKQACKVVTKGKSKIQQSDK